MENTQPHRTPGILHTKSQRCRWSRSGIFFFEQYVLLLLVCCMRACVRMSRTVCFVLMLTEHMIWIGNGMKLNQMLSISISINLSILLTCLLIRMHVG